MSPGLSMYVVLEAISIFSALFQFDNSNQFQFDKYCKLNEPESLENGCKLNEPESLDSDCKSLSPSTNVVVMVMSGPNNTPVTPTSIKIMNNPAVFG